MDFPIAETPLQAIEMLEEAFQLSDLDGIMRLYEEEALAVPAPGMEVRGTLQIRHGFSEALRMGIRSETQATCVLEADGIAIYLAHWSLQMPDDVQQHLTATMVLRKHPEAGWRILIDNPRGPALLHQT
jgi:ketosteroid isomerase-like protein